MIDEQGHIFVPVAERRDVDVDDPQAIEKILAKIARCDAFCQIAVRRRDNAHIDGRGGVMGADRVHFSGFEKPQEQRLHPQAHFSHLVEKEGPAVGHLKLPLLITVGAGEASLRVTEQFGLEEGLGEPGAVDRDEWSCRARGAEMDLPGDQVLTDSAFAGNQNFRDPRRRPPRHRKHVQHLCARGDDLRAPRLAWQGLVARPKSTALILPFCDTAAPCRPSANSLALSPESRPADPACLVPGNTAMLAPAKLKP